MTFVAAFNAWTRGAGGLAGVIGNLFALRDKRPYYAAAPGPGDD